MSATYDKSNFRVRSRAKHLGGGEDPITEINVTPLVDVGLVLVIIFMTVAPFVLQSGINVSQSKAGAAKGKHAIGENVQIELTAEGGILVNGEIVEREKLAPLLREKIPASKDKLVTLSAADENRVGEVVQILDLCKQMGAVKVAILKKAEQ